MKLINMLTTCLLMLTVNVCAAPTTSLAPRDDKEVLKAIPFVVHLDAIADATQALHDDVQEWNGHFWSMGTWHIFKSTRLVKRRIKGGIKRLKHAQHLHVNAEIKLQDPSKRVATATFDTLQLMVNRKDEFKRAWLGLAVRHALRRQHKKSNQLTDVILTHLGPLGRLATNTGRVHADVWFGETIYAFLSKDRQFKDRENELRRRATKHMHHIAVPESSPVLGAELGSIESNDTMSETLMKTNNTTMV